MIDQQVIDVALLGVPQRRRRHVLVASLRRAPDIAKALSTFRREQRSVSWALGDLLRLKPERAFDKARVTSVVNQNRIAYLFGRDEYDLPDDMRPDCHRLSDHSYKSVYGRMH
jgi:DNA (cytosine-5)-methyltransferase 1